MATLNDLDRGETATITEVNGDDAISVRLMEMGLIEGESITLIGFAPLRDPIEVEVRGYHVSLRRTEAARIEIHAD